MPLRRLFVMGCLIGAIFALTSPFWYFSSDQEREAHETPATHAEEHNDQHTGRTGTIMLDPNGALSVGAAAPTNHDQASELSPAKQAKPSSADPVPAISVHAESSTTGSIDITPTPATQPHSGLSTTDLQARTTQEPEPPQSPADSKATESSNRTTESTSSASEDSSSATDGTSTSTSNTPAAESPVMSAEGTAQISARSEHQALSEEVVATPDFSEEHADNSEVDAKTAALEQEIAALVAKQSTADKQAYQEALVARQEQVDAAIATIAQNSKQYYPPLMSRRALVVFFSVPYEAQVKNDAASQAALSQLLQQGAVGLPPLRSLYSDNSQEQASAKAPDALTGATTIYLSNEAGDLEAHQALRFIATTLSEESGAGLYEISPVTTYATDLVELYTQALNEQLSRHYPELTDDTPLVLDNFDTIYLCYPNWWHDLPSAVYSFFNKFDLSNKLVIPICLSAGDGPALTASTFSYLAPNATLAPWRLSLTHQDCSDATKLSHKLRYFLIEISQNLNQQVH